MVVYIVIQRRPPGKKTILGRFIQASAGAPNTLTDVAKAVGINQTSSRVEPD